MYLVIKKEYANSYEGSSIMAEKIYGIFKNRENAEKEVENLKKLMCYTEIKEIATDFIL